MRFVFILLLILSFSAQALIIKNDVSDHKDRCIVDGSGNEASLKLILTKVSFPDDDDGNELPDSCSVLLKQSIRFGEAIEINFTDYFPSYTLGDEIFLSAFFDAKTSLTFANERTTTQGLSLAKDDTVVFWADVFFAQLENKKNSPLHQFYLLCSYVEGLEQERPDLLGFDDNVSAEELSS